MWITVLRQRKKTLIASIALAASTFFAGFANAQSSESPGINALRFFFNEVKTFEAAFGQVVLDESLETVDDGKGKVWIKRPGLFRWDYEPPEAQEIVGDGERVWIYDIELEQINVRNQQAALGRTPAILLAGGVDMDKDYIIVDIGAQGRFDWVNLVPKDEESGFTEIRIGFEDNRLRLMELLDTLGQRTRMTFVDIKENHDIPDKAFIFVPPPGVDIVDESSQ